VDIIESFICVNFSKVNNLASELTVEELGNLLKREDLNYKTDNLLLFTAAWCAHHAATKEQNEELVGLVGSVTRKPANVLVAFGGSGMVEIFNNLSDTWTSHFCSPFEIAYHGLQPLQDKLYIIGGYSDIVGYRGESKPSILCI
jgi:hypothetical protein